MFLHFALVALSLLCSVALARRSDRHKVLATNNAQSLHGDARKQALSLLLWVSNPRHGLFRFRPSSDPSRFIIPPRSRRSLMRRVLLEKSCETERSETEPERRRGIFRVAKHTTMSAEWQGEPGKRYRFVDNSNDGLLDECDLYGISCTTPNKYTGLRSPGISEGSYRLDFILPGRDKNEVPKTLELLESLPNSNPSFGAVRVQLPIEITLYADGSNLFVRSVRQSGNGAFAGIRENDIIRAVSIPAGSEEQDDGGTGTLLNASVVWAPVPVPVPVGPLLVPWPVPLPIPAQFVPERIRPENVLRQVRDIATRVPKSEEGLVFLDGKSPSDYDRALRLGRNEVILVIERQFDYNALTDADIGRRSLQPGLPTQPARSTGNLYDPQLLIGNRPRIRQPLNTQGRKILDPEARQAAINVMLKDLPDILSEELNWDLYAEDFHIIDDLGDRWDGKEDNKNLVNLLRNLVANFVVRYTCEPRVQVVNGEIVGEWYVGLFGIQFPVLPFAGSSDLQIDLTVKTTYRFNDENLVDELLVENFYVNDERIGLPPVESAEISFENVKKIFDWATPILSSGLLTRRGKQKSSR